MKIAIIITLILSNVFISLQGNLKSTKPPHITEILTRNFPPVTEHSLWRNMQDLNYKSAVFNGVKGPQWTPAIAEENNSFNHIASPVPNQERKRIIANDLPPRTISPSSYDYPKRKDVIQVTLPTSTMKTVEYVIDPNNQMGKVATGSLYHGINSLPQKVSTFGYQKIFRFKSKVNPTEIGQIYNESVNIAANAEKKADKLLGKITNNLLQDSMIIPIVTINKNEHPELKLNVKNQSLQQRKDELKHSIVGAKASLRS